LGAIVKLHRRHFLGLAAVTATLSAGARVVLAQTYPVRPVRIVMGFPAGIAPDVIARLVAQSMSERLGQQFIVENRPGAATNIATEVVAHAQGDGYTLLVISSTNTINVTLFDNLGFDFVRDIAPVAGLFRSPNVLAINPAVPAETLPEFITYAKANPDKVNYASPGNGTATNLAGELFKAMAGVNMVHVPYRSNYFPDLLGGQVQAAFTPVAVAVEYINSGKLRALAVTGNKRSDLLPDIPTVAEFVPGYEAYVWDGIGAPRATAMEIIDQLNKEINAVLSDPNMQARLLNLGVEPMVMTPVELETFIAAESKKWATVVKAAGIKPE
jgi:tripartite-type tricarboxylate transporter receptor subunit TctC